MVGVIKDRKAGPSVHPPPEVARGAYFHGRGIFFDMKYFSA